MNPKQPARFAAPLLALAMAGALPATAQAQGMSDSWQFEAAIYGWFPAISGNTSFPDGGGSSIDLSTGDVLDALKFAFFTAFQVRNGEWGLFTDIAYADLGDSKSGSRDFTIGGRPVAGVTANLDLDVKSWIWTIAGTYQLKNDDAASMDLLFGARMLDMTNRLRWSLNGSGGNLARSGEAEVGATNWDAVIGLKGRAYLGQDRKWFVPYYADIGAGESKMTWQVNAGVGYQFDWGALIGSWRYLDYEFKSSSHIESQSFSGPLVGVVFKF
ncbi:MAG: hypothetical protein H6R06_4154 [Proteobacteria bacterium]|jgi:hypothetical protein|nr:hypothetical protein [Pseudomonadota bacterium]